MRHLHGLSNSPGSRPSDFYNEWRKDNKDDKDMFSNMHVYTNTTYAIYKVQKQHPELAWIQKRQIEHSVSVT